jgi:hypothetical protein
MSRITSLALAGLIALGSLCLAPPGRAAPLAPAREAQVTLPTIPDPVAVSLPVGSTAFLALDLVDPTCANRPACVASLPAVQAGLTAARNAGVPVIYSVVGGNSVDPAVAPQPNEPVLQTFGADKFYNTNLDSMLKTAGVTTLVITGTSANGAVLYTAFEAALRGYTVVVAEDGISSNTDFATFLTEWQLLNGPGSSNPQNMPLQKSAVTLSRLDLITYMGQTVAAGSN